MKYCRVSRWLKDKISSTPKTTTKTIKIASTSNDELNDIPSNSTCKTTYQDLMNFIQNTQRSEANKAAFKLLVNTIENNLKVMDAIIANNVKLQRESGEIFNHSKIIF